MADLASSPHYHLVPGRLRVKLARLKRNEAKARLAVRQLRTLDGVRDVSANTLTGSLVVRFDPAVTKVARMLDALTALGLMDGAAQPGENHLVTYTRQAHVATPAPSPLADVLVNKALEKLVERCAVALVAALI
ncbi:MAG TPA: hypothetical protein VGZ01_03035 [Trinickia sp.]|nr:hypothetical protein [Trinickia sp.]